MKKQIILLSLLLIIFTNGIFSQQLENWGITSKFIDFNPSFSVSNLLAPGGGSNYTGTKAGYSQTSYHDPLGNLMFFIVDGLVYDHAGYYIGNLGTGLNTEIIVIPANEESYCGDYYLFYGSSNYSSRVYWRMLRMDQQNPNFSDPTKKGLLSSANYIGLSLTGGCQSLMLGITPKVANGDRYLYAANCSHLNKILIQSNGTFTFQNGWLMPNNYTSHGLRSELEIVKLANNTYKVAVPYLYESSPPTLTYHWEIAVFDLNTSGNYTVGTATYWGALSASTTQLFKGFEFSPDGQYLYFTQTHSPYLKYINLGSTLVYELKAQYTPSSIPNASEFKDRQIELGTDNKLYYVANNRLASLANPNTPTTSTWTNSVSGTQFTSNFYPLTYGQYSPTSPDYGLRLLLDQIDGQDYTYDFNNTCCEDITQWDEVTETLPSSPTTQMWTTGSGNPYNANVIRIKSSLTIPNGVTLTIRGMTVEFGAGATLNVGTGAHLKLENAFLQSTCPKTMWQGIVVTGTGDVIMTNYGFLASSAIYDAVIGISLSGTSAKAIVNNLSYFERNETHVKIDNGGTLNSFTYSAFSHLVPLKDQTKGLDQNGLTSGTRYGVKGIEILNCSNFQTIGTTSPGLGNWFIDGQYGVTGANSNINVYQNSFQDIRTRGVVLDGQWSGRTLNVTNGNIFDGCKTAIDGYYGTNMTVQGNSFTGGYEHGVKWFYNPGRILKIGDITTPSLGNNFQFQNWSCVLTNDNANASTQITVANNTMENSSWAYGVLVQETTLAGTPSYSFMKINHNNMDGIDYGVKVLNVRGISGQSDAFTPQFPTTTMEAYDNEILNFTLDKHGIDFSSSPNTRIMVNDVTSTDSEDWEDSNTGIFAFNSAEMAVGGNYSSSATGIRYCLSMLGSNIACNTVDNCVVGIDIALAELRGNYVNHGSSPTGDNRRNIFTNMTGVTNLDMRVITSWTYKNKWVSPGTTDIDDSGANDPAGTIFVSGGSDRCDEIFDMMVGGGEEEALFASSEEAEPTTDENFAWLETYEAQVKQNEIDASVSVTDNAFIPKLIQVGNSISGFDFETAQENFNHLEPVHEFEKNYVEVFKVILAYRPEEPRNLTEDEKSTLIKIAEQKPWEAGPAVFSARAVLKFKENMDFLDAFPPPAFLYESGKTDETTLPETPSSIQVFPNPGKQYLSVTGIDGIAFFSITDIQGRELLSGLLSSNGTIDAHSLSAGTYSLKLSGSHGEILNRTLWVKEE
jgi:hypothetical protein